MALRLNPASWVRWSGLIGALCLACLGGQARPAEPAPPPTLPEAKPAVLSLNDAVAWALQNNPNLAAVRQQHGIASAGVVIAETYPYNPSWTNKLFAVNGPESSGITNRLAMEQRVSLDLEIRHQGKFRRRAAGAALRRTEWEIAQQKVNLAIQVIRAYAGV